MLRCGDAGSAVVAEVVDHDSPEGDGGGVLLRHEPIAALEVSEAKQQRRYHGGLQHQTEGCHGASEKRALKPADPVAVQAYTKT